MLSRNVILYGDEADLPRFVPLCAGPLSLYFEAGDLRYVRLGEHEVLRRVYVAVRDRNWATIPMRMSNLRIDAADDRFTITYSADHREREIDFHWESTIQGTSEGCISFSMQGEARSTFLKNRIGFCVLHPPECADKRCRIVQEFGEVVEKPFPRLIAPAPKEDPFQEIRQMSYEVVDGVHAGLSFEGDVFETEDQRNWSDGSYKTFCTPLRLPFPVEITSGAKVSQRVELTVRATAPPLIAAPHSEVRVQVGTSSYALPKIGLSLSPAMPNARQIERVKRLNLSHLRADLRLNASTAREDYLRAAEHQERLEAPLELAVYASEDYERELAQLSGWIQSNHRIARWIIFQAGQKTTPPNVLTAAKRILTTKTPHAPFGGGSDAYFTELNRDRPDLHAADFVCYSVNPQVHAFDNTSLVENARAIGYTVESAHALSNGRSIAITPITLRPRYNPDATGDIAAGDAMPDSVDPRQMSLFGGAWTLASLQTIIESRVTSATYYQTVGWNGVIERDEGSPAPERFRSVPGGVFPMYHVFAAWGEFNGGQALKSTSSNPLSIAAVVLQNEKRQRILIANLKPFEQRLVLEGAAGVYHERRLDEFTALAAMQAPEDFCELSPARVRFDAGGSALSVPPYGTLILDRG